MVLQCIFLQHNILQFSDMIILLLSSLISNSDYHQSQPKVGVCLVGVWTYLSASDMGLGSTFGSVLLVSP